ncbi:MAG: creatininase family protein [Anaerolineae bacterium]|nr:creatininase family protein [Anaerolineae bacterium]
MHEYHYDKLTWPEIKKATAEDRVIILPVGSTEQHGPHLPLDVDNFLCQAICEGAAQRVPEDVLLMPPMNYGFNWHHIDFPGTIGIGWEPYIHFLLDIVKSVAYHGFKKVLIINGHGSNRQLIEIVARQATMDHPIICAACNYFALGAQAVAETRESPKGWVAHADEFETSLYLYLRPEGVRRDLVQAENNMLPSNFWWQDLIEPAPLGMMEWWSSFSHTGVLGDPTKASAEKGRILYEACVEGLVALIREFKARPLRPREDHH